MKNSWLKKGLFFLRSLSKRKKGIRERFNPKKESLLLEAEAVRAVIEGMKSENAQNIRDGWSTRWKSSHFNEQANKLIRISKEMESL